MASTSRNYNWSEITSFELYWLDPYATIQSAPEYRIGIFGFLVSILITGNLMNVSMIIFERFGEDPQKRSVLNQLTNQMNAGIIAFYTLVHMPCLLWRTMISPVSTVGFNVWWFSASTFLVSFALAGMEHILLKYFSVVVFGRVLPIMDDFFARFFLLANVATSSFMGLVNCYSVEYFEIEMRASGLPTSMNRYDKFKPRVIAVCAVFCIVVGAAMSIKISNVKRKLVHAAIRHTVNNQRYNKDTVSVKMLAFLLFLASLGLPVYYLGHQSGDLESSSFQLVLYLFSDVGHVIIFMIVFPGLGFAANQELRAYIVNLVASNVNAAFKQCILT